MCQGGRCIGGADGEARSVPGPGGDLRGRGHRRWCAWVAWGLKCQECADGKAGDLPGVIPGVVLGVVPGVGYQGWGTRGGRGCRGLRGIKLQTYILKAQSLQTKFVLRQKQSPGHIF